MLLQVLLEGVGPPPVKLTEPPVGQRMPGDTEAVFMHCRQPRNVPGPRIGSHQHWACIVPYRAIFTGRRYCYAPAVRQSRAVSVKVRLGKLRCSDRKHIKKSGFREFFRPAAEQVEILPRDAGIRADMRAHKRWQAVFPSRSDPRRETVRCRSESAVVPVDLLNPVIPAFCDEFPAEAHSCFVIDVSGEQGRRHQ